MADTGAWNDAQHAVEQAVAGSQDADEHEFLAVDDVSGGALQRGFDGNLLQGHVPGDFIGHERAELAEQAPEAVGAGFLVAHEGELVLHEGVGDVVNVGHENRSLEAGRRCHCPQGPWQRAAGSGSFARMVGQGCMACRAGGFIVGIVGIPAAGASLTRVSCNRDRGREPAPVSAGCPSGCPARRARARGLRCGWPTWPWTAPVRRSGHPGGRCGRTGHP